MVKKKKEEVIEIKGFKAWVIVLLITVIVLQILIKFPIEINTTITDCPEVICKEVVCKTTVEIINKTVIERKDSNFFIEWEDWKGGTFINNSP